MPVSPHSPAFRALQAQWYSRLRETGFVDIERPGEYADDKILDHWLDSAEAARRGARTGAAEWHRLAYEWTDLAVWESRSGRLVWVLLCDGWSQQEIIQRGLFARCARHFVHRTVRANRGEMKEWFTGRHEVEGGEA